MTHHNDESQDTPQGVFGETADVFGCQIWFYDGLKAALDGQLPLAYGRLKRTRGVEIARAYKAGYRTGQQIQQQMGEGDPIAKTSWGKILGENANEWYVRGLLDAVMGYQPQSESVLRCRYGDEAAATYWDGFDSLAKFNN